MDKKEILAMLYILDESDSGCLSRAEINTKNEIADKSEKRIRYLFKEFYKKYHKQKNMEFLFYLVYKTQEGSVKCQIVKENFIEKNAKNITVIDICVFLVHYKNDKKSEFYISNCIEQFLKSRNDQKDLVQDHLFGVRKVKRVQYNQKVERENKKIKDKQPSQKHFSKEKIIRKNKGKNSSILGFFKQKQ